eukprot:9097526-Pyramimonas_sp.AAC.1
MALPRSTLPFDKDRELVRGVLSRACRACRGGVCTTSNLWIYRSDGFVGRIAELRFRSFLFVGALGVHNVAVDVLV